MIPGKADHVERLWTASDGTICMIVTCDVPPCYSVTLVRDERVVRERRLYGRASAQMVAQGWSEAQALRTWD
jgi:hypothetical protein